MVAINSNKVVIGGRLYNATKAGYPAMPTVYSGVEVTWGAESCIDHPEAARANISLWIPKTHVSWLPKLGEEVVLDAAILPGDGIAYTQTVTYFAGKVESVKLQDDHKPIPAPVIPNSQTMENVGPGVIGGWETAYATSFSGTYASLNGSTTVSGGNTLHLQFQNGSTHYFSVKSPDIPVTAGKSYTITWETNNTAAHSMIVRYYNASNALIGSAATTFNHYNRFDFTAPAGAVKMTFDNGAVMVSSFRPEYIIGNFILGSQDTAAGYRVNLVAADALAEASRLRLFDSPWPMEWALTRQTRIADLATKSGVKFNAGLTADQGYYEALDTAVTPRDVDSYPALEAFQRTTMSAGHTVISSNNVVEPSSTLELPEILTGNQTGATVTYGYNATGSGRHEQFVSGALNRTNWASNTDFYTYNYLTAVPGTGGTVSMGIYSTSQTSPAKYGNRQMGFLWTVGSTSGTPGASYKQTAITGASASRVSGGMWVRSATARSYKMLVNLFSGATPVGTLLGASIAAPANTWTWVPVHGATATGAYDTVELVLQAQSNTVNGETIFIDGILIEKATTAGSYFDQYTLDSNADVDGTVRADIPVFDSSAIWDDVFELDTSKVVNEIKVEMKRVVSTVEINDFDQVYTDAAGAVKTTPQTRSISTDWAILDADVPNLLPTSVMVTKGRLLLAGQSQPQWRMSNALSLVLGEVPNQASLYKLFNERFRFGQLIHITNGPSFVSQYMRVRGGRIVLGDEPALEFDLEPVEYSAPIPLSGATLSGDPVAANYRIRNFKTLTSNDLRTIGAR